MTKISVTTKEEMWKDKAKLDFDVDLPLDTAKKEYEDIDYADSLLKNANKEMLFEDSTILLKIVQKYPNYRYSHELFRMIARTLINTIKTADERSYESEEADEKLGEVAKIALEFEIADDQDYTNWLLYELFDSELHAELSPGDELYDYFFGSLMFLFRDMKNIKASRLFKVLMRLFKNRDEIKRVWETRSEGIYKIEVFGHLVSWLKTASYMITDTDPVYGTLLPNVKMVKGTQRPIHEKLDFVQDVTRESLAGKIIAIMADHEER
jgi:hypothetical protein